MALLWTPNIGRIFQIAPPKMQEFFKKKRDNGKES
jgi:hypothetical protein